MNLKRSFNRINRTRLHSTNPLALIVPPQHRRKDRSSMNQSPTRRPQSLYNLQFVPLCLSPLAYKHIRATSPHHSCSIRGCNAAWNTRMTTASRKRIQRAACARSPVFMRMQIAPAPAGGRYVSTCTFAFAPRILNDAAVGVRWKRGRGQNSARITELSWNFKLDKYWLFYCSFPKRIIYLL